MNISSPTRVLKFFQRISPITWIILGIAVLFFILHLPLKTISPIADAQDYLDNVLAVYQNHFNPFIEVWSYKPPLLFITTALLFQYFGPSLQTANIFIFFLSSLSLITVYVVGQKLFTTKIAVISFLFLLFSPIFINQSFLFQDAIPVIPLLLLCVYAYLKNHTVLYLMLCSLLVLYKEPYIIVPIYTALFELMRTKKINRSLLLLLPVVFFVAWIMINKYTFGWYLWQYNVDFISFSIPAIFAKIQRIFLETPFSLYVLFFIYFGSIIFSTQFKLKNNTTTQKNLTYLVGFIALFRCIFIILPYTPRYLLPIFPFDYFILAWGITQTMKPHLQWKIIVCSIAIPLFTQGAMLSSLPVEVWGEDDVFRRVELNHRIVKEIQKITTQDVVILNQKTKSFDNPFYGYTKQKNPHIIDEYFWNCLENPKTQFQSIQNNVTYNNPDKTPVYIFIESTSNTGYACIYPPPNILLVAQIHYTFLYATTYASLYQIIQ